VGFYIYILAPSPLPTMLLMPSTVRVSRLWLGSCKHRIGPTRLFMPVNLGTRAAVGPFRLWVISSTTCWRHSAT